MSRPEELVEQIKDMEITGILTVFEVIETDNICKDEVQI